MQSYPDYTQACGWNAVLPERQAARVLQTNVDCDVVVIGAGYTGAAAAKCWAECHPEHRIVLLDASTIGEGNAGRNSGFLLEASLASDIGADNRAELDRLRRCNSLIADAMKSLTAMVDRYNIDCQLRRSGTYRAAAGKAGADALERYAEFLGASDMPFDRLDATSLAERIGTTFYANGLYSPDCYLVQPAALIRGIVDALPDNVEVFENLPAINIQRIRNVWHVSLPNQEVRAPSVIVANNAFAAGLGIGASRVTPIYTYAAITAELPKRIAEHLGADEQWGVLPAHRLGSTLRRTADNRLLIRSLYDYRRARSMEAAGIALKDALVSRFSALHDVSFEHLWTGATGLTLNGAPLWGEYGNRLFVSAGCNGGGVVKGTLFGTELAKLALGQDTVDVNGLFGKANWMPPEPLRRVGFQVISRHERRKGKAEV